MRAQLFPLYATRAATRLVTSHAANVNGTSRVATHEAVAHAIMDVNQTVANATLAIQASAVSALHRGMTGDERNNGGLGLVRRWAARFPSLIHKRSTRLAS